MSAGDTNFDLSGELDLSGFEGDLAYLPNFNFQDAIFDPVVFEAFAKEYPEDAELLRAALGNQARDIDDASISENVIYTGDPDNSYKTAEENKFKRQTTGVPVGDPDDPDGTKKLAAISGGKTSITDKVIEKISKLTGLDKGTVGELGKYGLLAGLAKMAYDDAQRARQEARGWTAPGGIAKQAVRSPGGGVSFKKAASGGVMSVLNEKGPEDYGVDQYTFMEANMPAGEASQFDIYGNLIMPDPYFRTLTGSETNQLERDAAREYYKDPENARLSYEIAKNLEDAVIAKGGMGEVDVQKTLRNIYNDPELKNMFFNYTGELKYAPMEAADLLDRDYELNKREAEGFTPDNNYIPGLAYELDRFNRDNPRIGHALEREMLKLVDPNAPRTFFRNYDYEEGEGNIRRGGGEGGIGGGYGGAAGGIASLQPKRKLPPRYLDGHSDGMADKVPANIDGRRPAALSDGEFVIPADVVSHLGNGNSNAGAKRLYKMMDDIRAARTGNPKQGKQINPDKFMPR